MKRLIAAIFAAAVGVETLHGGPASAAFYPVAPPGYVVNLQPGDFIQSVPQQTPGLPVPNPVIGDNLGQHPGAFGSGFPPTGTYFIGVIGNPIDISSPATSVFLWETTSPPNIQPFPGPQIQVGFWDGTAFTPKGIPQTASYLGTGFRGEGGREINSSITPLSAFQIPAGSLLNAVRIDVVNQVGHNQVTAVAIAAAIPGAVPAPSALVLLGTGLACLFGYDRRRKSATGGRGEAAGGDGNGGSSAIRA